jgi:hypothetical protein
VGKSWEIIGTYGKISGKPTKIMGKSWENQTIWERKSEYMGKPLEMELLNGGCSS